MLQSYFQFPLLLGIVCYVNGQKEREIETQPQSVQPKDLQTVHPSSPEKQQELYLAWHANEKICKMQKSEFIMEGGFWGNRLFNSFNPSEQIVYKLIGI